MHATLGDQLTDLVQNALEARATKITVRIKENGQDMWMEVIDNGCGMSEDVQARALDPMFSDGVKHPHRRVGLGLPFLRQTADATGGNLILDSTPGLGTRVCVRLGRHHLDLPPLGDLSAALCGLMAFDGTYELEIERERDGRCYRVSRRDLSEALGGLETAMDLALAKNYIASQEEALHVKGNEDGSDDT